MDNRREICPHCHRAMNVHTFTLSKSLANCLIKIAQHYGPRDSFNSKDLLDRHLISPSDYTNMSHLKYLGLIRKVDGEKRRWALTEAGEKLIEGGYCPSWVKVFGDKVIDRSPCMITLKETVGYYEIPQNWARRAERLHPVGERQQSFF